MKASHTEQAISEELRPYVERRQRVKAEGRSRLKKRHQSGLKQAKELADVLKTDFGVTKVVLFGSMLSVNNTHMSSDIDLAVWDLPSKDYLEALSALVDRSKAFRVDLVRIEEASDSLMSYIARAGLILGASIPESDMLTRDNPSMPNYTALAGRIHRELKDIDVQYIQTRGQLETARETDQVAYWMAVSLGLHGIYTGLEKIFEQIARDADGYIDKKSDRWHKDLLEQMTATMPNIRPAVIDEKTFRALEQYLAFRHVVRSSYAYRLEPKRIDENFQILENCYDSLVKQLNAFCNFLLSVS